ncbi:TPA: rhomboid family intramembrane serine protease [Escherichia coli]|nr:rhomboid family intramembrane serine protease [Escherichia coli]
MSASSVKPLNVQLPAITLILFALCVGIFCYLAQWMSYEEVDQSALIHLGANVASLTLSGEPWRLLSSVFLHSSFSHLLMNMFALLVVGTVAERILGKWRLLIIWLFSGIFGGLISACYALRESEQIVISVGASGAIMGIAGAAIATQLSSGAGSRSVYSVEGISPDGQYLALVSYGLQGYVILLNINAGQIIGVYPASYVNHLRFSADGRKIFVMAKNGLIQMDRTRSLDPQAIIRHPQYGDVACIPEP